MRLIVGKTYYTKPMTRLIDADALAYEILSKYGADGGTEDVNTIYEMIINAPTIDIAEVCGECKPYEPCIYCKHDFENKFEAGGAKMDKGGDTE